MNESAPERFDQVVSMEIYDGFHDVVLHRGPTGDVVCFHSPLDNGAVKCAICEGGARVYMEVGPNDG